MRDGSINGILGLSMRPYIQCPSRVDHGTAAPPDTCMRSLHTTWQYRHGNEANGKTAFPAATRAGSVQFLRSMVPQLTPMPPPWLLLFFRGIHQEPDCFRYINQWQSFNSVVQLVELLGHWGNTSQRHPRAFCLPVCTRCD